MKQLSLFETDTQDTVTGHTTSQDNSKKKHAWKLFVDGASRGNPGPAGAGVYLLKDSKKEYAHGFFLGKKTNNQAEYLALLLGAFKATKKMAATDTLEIISDSQLLIRQIQGIYRVKNEELAKLHAKALALLKPFCYTSKHVLRADNSIADALANEGVDKKIPVPHDFTHWLTN